MHELTNEISISTFTGIVSVFVWVFSLLAISLSALKTSSTLTLHIVQKIFAPGIVVTAVILWFVFHRVFLIYPNLLPGLGIFNIVACCLLYFLFKMAMKKIQDFVKADIRETVASGEKTLAEIVGSRRDLADKSSTGSNLDLAILQYRSTLIRLKDLGDSFLSNKKTPGEESQPGSKPDGK